MVLIRHNVRGSSIVSFSHCIHPSTSWRQDCLDEVDKLVLTCRAMTRGERIRGWRTFRGLSRADLAERIGVSRQAIRGWEDGLWEPSDENDIALADALGVPRVSSPTLPDPPSQDVAS